MALPGASAWAQGLVELTLGVPYSDSLAAQGQEKYYHIAVPASGDHLVAVLEKASHWGSRLDLRYGALPSDSQKDDTDGGFNDATDQAVEAMTTQEGNYFFRVRAEYPGAGGTFAITAYTLATFPTLPVGEPVSASLLREYAERWYHVDPGVGQHLVLVLTKDSHWGSQLDLRYGALPKGSQQDDTDGGFNDATDQAVEAVFTQEGSYFVRVYANYPGAGGAFTITAHTLTTFPTLSVGEPVSASLPREYAERWYQVRPGPWEHLMVFLAKQTSFGSRLDIKYDYLPRDNNSDDTDGGFNDTTDQAVENISTQSGPYFVRVRAEYPNASTRPFTLTASTVPLLQATGTVADASTSLGLGCAVVHAVSTDGTVDRIAATDINGAYRLINLRSATYIVEVVSPGFQPQTTNLVVPGSGISFSLTPAAGADTIIVGRISDATSTLPLAGVRVDASVDGTPIATTYTCAEGRYELREPVTKAAFVQLTYSAFGYYSESREVDVTPGGGAQLDVPMTPKSTMPGSVAGYVKESTNHEPLAGSRVTATMGGVGPSVDANESGYYFIGLLEPGPYVVDVSRTGYRPQWQQTTVNAGDLPVMAGADFQLDPLSSELLERCDVSGDGKVDAVDVQMVINGALGLDGGHPCDVSLDGKVDAVDVQLVINGALGLISRRR
ncbi:MAG: carboxypeptidase regulatory-like domain-containing protein [Candidatus Hydrogenedentes bacterium]|nr:carboxypeptidase regulatory-like domain-containing protein [Candidatus Hydrogenedentota bacterium]